jgi:hypothetical protein
VVSVRYDYAVVSRVAKTRGDSHPAFISLNRVPRTVEDNVIALNFNRLHDYVVCEFVDVAVSLDGRCCGFNVSVASDVDSREVWTWVRKKICG